VSGALPPLGSSAAWWGGHVSDRAQCILAPNAGPLTLDGTNTWLLAEPGAAQGIVVDPGPDDEGHLGRVVAAAGQRGVRVVLVLLTHAHVDHAGGARRLGAMTGAPVRALDPRFAFGGEGLHDGDVVAVGGLQVAVVATPGHSADSLSFHLPADRALLTGDTVLGRGTSVVAPPDGRLADYVASLHRLRALAAGTGADRVLPGHGPAQDDLAGLLDAYQAHRQARLQQVREAVAAGAGDERAVVAAVYTDVDRRLWPAAELSVRAQLDYLRETGEL